MKYSIIFCVPRASGDKPEAYISNRIGLRVFPAPAGINRPGGEKGAST
ncbi:hypothetical protein JYB52_000925 [Escherichia coli]|nr:hypothetical protein [Escherichia coli]EHB3439941.1 hypothetical protein [Escherichia coli]